MQNFLPWSQNFSISIKKSSYEPGPYASTSSLLRMIASNLRQFCVFVFPVAVAQSWQDCDTLIMYFRFYGWRHIWTFHEEQTTRKRHILNDSPRGSTRLGGVWYCCVSSYAYGSSDVTKPYRAMFSHCRQSLNRSPSMSARIGTLSSQLTY